MVADNTKPLPEAQDQKKSGTQPSTFEHAEATATQRILDENRGVNNNNAGGDNNPSTTESGALKTKDGSDSGTPGTDSVADLMLQEVETDQRTKSESADAVAKMRAAGISPELAAEFGSPEMFDSLDPSDRSGTDALVEAAKAKDAKLDKATPGDAGDSSVIGDALTDFGNWAAESFNKYVAEPVSEAMSDISTAFDDAVQWFDQEKSFVPVTGAIADINNGTDEYRAAKNQASRSNRFDLNNAHDRSGEELRLPENATDAGTVTIGGNEVSVMKTPEGDTYLKNGDKVIGHQKPDGSYELGLQDGSTLDFKLSQGADGKYKLDHLERTKDGKLQQKVADGVFYNYNYDAQGNRTSVDAAGDLKGPLSPERLEAIKKELGDSGAAALRVTDEKGKTDRLLMQVHDQDTSSLTDIDAKRAQIFHDGKEYRLNEKDQLGIVDSNGDWQAPDSKPEKADQPENPDDKPEESAEDKARREAVEQLRAAQLKQLEELARRLGKRAQGDSDEAIDGVKLRTDDDGNANVTREDPSTGEPLTTTEIPKDADKPIVVINSAHERTEIRGEDIDVRTADGDRLFDFNSETGLSTDNVQVDSDGMNFLDSTGEFIGSGDGDDQFDGEDCEDCQEVKVAKDISRTTSAQLVRLADSVMVSINNGDLTGAMQVGNRALNLALGASNMVPDMTAQIPISHAISNIRGLLERAGSAAQYSPATDRDQDRLLRIA